MPGVSRTNEEQVLVQVSEKTDQTTETSRRYSESQIIANSENNCVAIIVYGARVVM